MERVDAQRVGASLLSNRNFGNERLVNPTGKYGSEYKLRSPAEQIEMLLRGLSKAVYYGPDLKPLLQPLVGALRSYKENLRVRHEDVAAELPYGAEGLFVIPPWNLLAPTYGSAFRVLADVLPRLSEFELNYDRERTSTDFLRETPHKASVFRRIDQTQSSRGLYLVPAQFGKLRCGQSDRYALAHLERGEFAFGAYEVSIMFISHPERMATLGDMSVTAPGDEVCFTGNGNFDSSPFFCSHLDMDWNHRIRVGVAARDGYGPNVGQVTGFWEE